MSNVITKILIAASVAVLTSLGGNSMAETLDLQLARSDLANFSADLQKGLEARSAPRSSPAIAQVPTKVPLGEFVPFLGREIEKVWLVENGQKVEKYWQQLTPEQWQLLLQDQFIKTQVYDAKSSAGLTALPGALSVGRGQYKLVYDNFRYKDYPCAPNDAEAGSLLVGVGLRIAVDANSKSSSLSLGIAQIALSASQKKVTGVIEANIVGLANSNTLSQVVAASSGALTYESLIEASNAYAVAGQALENITALSNPRIIGYKDQRAEGSCLAAMKAVLTASAPSRTAISKKPAAGGDRIIGGVPVRKEEMPWIVHLEISTPAGTFICGGTLIDPDWVASAAHCVTDEYTGKISAKPEGIDGYLDTTGLSSPQTLLTFDKLIRHEGYNFRTQDNDVVLLRIASARDYAEPTKTALIEDNVIRLVTPETSRRFARPDSLAIVAGWGRTETEYLSPVLMRVGVQVVSNERCNAPVSYGGVVTDNMLCAGFAAGGRDSCQGDSGGPLTVNGQGGKKLLAGIVSWGYGCAEENLFGVYTRVENYVDWIAQNISAESD